MTTMIEELAAHPELIYRHSVDDYHDMITHGTIIEGEPFELLDGQIVRKIRSASGEDLMTVGIEHALIVNRLGKMSALLEPFGCHLRIQQPITLPPRDEPEPDGVIAKGTIEDFAEHHPFAEDILCVIEVADSSVSRDRGYKMQRYAAAALPLYIIINLIDRAIEIYEKPNPSLKRFAKTSRKTAGDSISFSTAAGTAVVVPVTQLLR